MTKSADFKTLSTLLLKMIGLLPIAAGFIGATFSKIALLLPLIGKNGFIALLCFEGLFLLIVEIFIIIIVIKTIGETFPEKETK